MRPANGALATDGASSIVITGSPETEKEIRRIPEVYGRDKVKQDVGQELLSQVGIMCPEQDWRRIRLMGGADSGTLLVFHPILE
jgi:hypothetical protein